MRAHFGRVSAMTKWFGSFFGSRDDSTMRDDSTTRDNYIVWRCGVVVVVRQAWLELRPTRGSGQAKKEKKYPLTPT